MADRHDDPDAPAADATDRPAAEDLDELFARALPGVERIAPDERGRVVGRRAIGRRQQIRPSSQGGRFRLERYDEIVTALSPGADALLLDRLRGGRIPPEAELDLHGHGVAAATVALDSFVARCVAEGRSCLLVIHGRGLRSAAGPVLKEAVIRHLTTGPLGRRILALATAPRGLGGPGALLVLLRRPGSPGP